MSRPERPLEADPEPLQLAPEAVTQAAFSAAVATACASRDFAPALGVAKALLQSRDPADDPYAPALLDLLAGLAAQDGAPRWLPVHFDGRVETCFEQMLSLIHQQNLQIAELWRIATEFV